ncbi:MULTISPECIES: ABC transporter ATP-binding protein [unclassified Mesorhizobium]|uniref:ABC transporter ATP-binding protein n=1 Tax=unclassified Mesorhizobium TaxID=325217 RepID=UPI00112E8BFD|nr:MULTISPECIES: sn-glycerol-3-phosphate ABC transporter ATP-binding protein UgpC [unclassified Mesorhizobium]MBZ9811281.1 sn-glycerol-3-phosphate ABC transporter ATP-binding protein UgpC [Mesorhizobium sp. ESP-6-2]TPM25854.1 sn-glycerol-3-phosphate ABC transporter ATP-binding protein UgpC [Mesorhizobium sp. B2-2-2]
MATVVIDKVRKYYGAVSIIKDVSVEIGDGEFIVLVGPSGCGKSTLLRMIAGLEAISGGEISIGSRVINNVSPKERDIAMVFQSYALYPHMTVLENMGFSLKLKGVPKADIASKARHAADILGIQSLLNRYPRQLSGGQRQRVAMGRAIVRDPQVFLFDEPLSNLDAKLRAQMRSEIKKIHQRLGTTTIYVTHDQIEAMTMADRIVVMRDGVVEQVGAPLDVYDRPANVFVAGFIGAPAMNLIEGKVCAGKSSPEFDMADGSRLPLPPNLALSVGQKVIYGIRPEYFLIAADGLAATVVVVEPTGSETQVVAKIGDQEVLAVIRERIVVEPGSQLNLKPDIRSIHIFDGDTGQRIGEQQGELSQMRSAT